jgi:hypothetical protein
MRVLKLPPANSDEYAVSLLSKKTTGSHLHMSLIRGNNRVKSLSLLCNRAVIHKKALHCLVDTIHRLRGQASLIIYYPKNASWVI